jgi:hypothetical protein
LKARRFGFFPFRVEEENGGKIYEIQYDSRLIGRSAWKSRWMLIIPGRSLLYEKWMKFFPVIFMVRS